MRKLIYAINLTIDGCCDHIKMNPEEEMLEFHTNGETKEDIEFARAFSSIKKIIVFSKTLGKAEGKNTELFERTLKTKY